jgi:hypothetical protein
MKQHVHCARLLCRAGAVTRDASGTKGAEELLCRMLLLGDGIAAAKLLLGDAYQLQVTDQLLDLLARIKYPNACTFTFAQVRFKRVVILCRVLNAPMRTMRAGSQSRRAVHVRVCRLRADHLLSVPRYVPPSLRVGVSPWPGAVAQQYTIK